MLKTCTIQDGLEVDPKGGKISKEKIRQILSLYQILYYILHHGQKRTPLHIMNNAVIYDLCRSSTTIRCLNRLGLCIGPDELMRYRNDMAEYVIKHGDEVPLPSRFDPSKFTTAATDNFDHEEGTVAGTGGSHDTVTVLFQEKQENKIRKPNRTQTNVSHGSRSFKVDLPCQKVLEFYKPRIRPDLPSAFMFQKNPMNCQNLNEI